MDGLEIVISSFMTQIKEIITTQIEKVEAAVTNNKKNQFLI